MNANTLIFAVLVALVAVAVLSRLKGGLGDPRPRGTWPYYVKKPLTVPEQVLYFRLVSAPPDHVVLAQVQMSRFLGVKKGAENPRSWFGRISQKSIDFLVCGKDATVLAAIELDDSSHERADRIAADETKNKALLDAGVRIIRWEAKDMPDTAAIRVAFALASPPALPVLEAKAAPTGAPPRQAKPGTWTAND